MSSGTQSAAALSSRTATAILGIQAQQQSATSTVKDLQQQQDMASTAAASSSSSSSSSASASASRLYSASGHAERIKRRSTARLFCDVLVPFVFIVVLALVADFIVNDNSAEGDHFRHRPMWMRFINAVVPDFDLREEWFLHGTEDEVARKGLAKVLEGLRQDAGLTKLGKIMAAAMVREQLNQRDCVMRTVNETLAQNKPPIRASKPPTVVIGLPRTGTTFMHGLLGSHTALRAPRFVEYMHSCGVAVDAINKQWQQSKMSLLRKMMPQLRSIHFIDADSPEEDIIALGHEMVSMIFFTSFYVPQYVEWLQDTSRSSALLDSLKYLRVFLDTYLRTDDRPWILKTPWHLVQIEEFVELFPGSSFVWMHRDPIPTLSSMIDLVVSLIGVGSDLPKDYQGQHILAKYVVDTWLWALERGVNARKKLEAQRRVKFVDVDFVALNNNPIQVAHEVFASLNMTLSAEDESALQRYVSDNKKGKRGEHSHRLEFGLDVKEIRQRYNAIMEGIWPARLSYSSST